MDTLDTLGIAKSGGRVFRLSDDNHVKVAQLLFRVPHFDRNGRNQVSLVRDLLFSMYNNGVPRGFIGGCTEDEDRGFRIFERWLARDQALLAKYKPDDAFGNEDFFNHWEEGEDNRRSPREALTELIKLANPQRQETKTDTQPSAFEFSIRPYECVEPESIPPREWLGRSRHMIREFLSVTASPGGTGKTSMTLVECLEMATGRRLLCPEPDRHPTATPLRVYYWNGEDPYIEVQRRIEAIRHHFGIRPEEIADRLFVGTADDVKIIVATDSREGVRINEPLFNALVDTITGRKIDVLVIDPFVRSHGVPENDNGKIDAVADVFRRIARKCKIGVELVHHVRKTGGEEITAEDMRGASALHGAARSVRVINPMSEDEAKKARVAERYSFFRVDDGKASMKRRAAKSARWYQLVSIGLRNARKGLAGDEVGVATSWTWPDVFDGVPEDGLHLAQQAVQGGECRADPRSPQWAGIAIAGALGLDLAEPVNAMHVKQLINVWTNVGGLKRVKLPDKDRKLRYFIVPGAPVQ